MKHSFNGAGRPVLVTVCEERFATGHQDGKAVMVTIPLTKGFGSLAYFEDDHIFSSKKVICCEYDSNRIGIPYTDFIQASDEVLLKHLESPLVDADFKEFAKTLIKECPLQEEQAS